MASLKEVKKYLKENLKIEIDEGSFTNPNSRSIRVWLEGELVTETTFNVKDSPEYEG